MSRRSSGLRAFAAGALALGVALPCVLFAEAVPTGTAVVINEVYGGGGNSGGAFNQDFIELYNPTAAPLDLTGMKVEYFSSAGNTGGVCTLSGSIPAGGYYLVGAAFGNTTSLTALPTVDAVCTNLALSGTKGSARLYATDGSTMDTVGFGAASLKEGTAAGGTANGTSVARKAAGVDTDNNSADFTVGTPTPQNSGTPVTPPMTSVTTPPSTTPPTTPPATTPSDTATPNPVPGTPISAIQGTGDASPMSGQTVTTRGVVTAVYPTGGFNGFYMQTPGTGGTAKTAGQASDGVFVYGVTTPKIGECYDVTATVKEFNGLTELDKATLAPATGCAAVTATPVTGAITADLRESYEGMLVLPTGPYTITNNYQLNTFGQIGLAEGTSPLRTATDVVAPSEAAAYEAANQAKAITLDDGASWNYMTNATAKNLPLPYVAGENNNVVVGAAVTFTQPVILDFRFQWNFQPTQMVAAETNSPATFAYTREAAPVLGGNVKIATFNVLNYFTDLGQSEGGCKAYTDRDGTPIATNMCQVRGAYTPESFQRQQAKIVAAINASGADVVGLEEIQNSALFGHDRDAALRDLVAALNADAGAEVWSYAKSPVAVPTGEDVIRSAFIYKSAKVAPVKDSLINSDPAFANAREPLAQEWKLVPPKPAACPDGTTPVTSEPKTFVTIANHFKSKGSGEDDGTGQGKSNPSRVEQANALGTWANEQFAGKPVFLIGDFNAYTMEDPISVLNKAGYIDGVSAFAPGEATYQFDGRVGSLDHILMNSAAKDWVAGLAVWDINGDYSVAQQYSRYNYNVTNMYAPNVYASSDHDPIVAGLNVPVPVTEICPGPTPTTPTPTTPTPGITTPWTGLQLPIPATPGVDDPDGAGNATWQIPANTADIIWGVDADGVLFAVAMNGMMFTDGNPIHFYGKAPETNTTPVTPAPTPTVTVTKTETVTPAPSTVTTTVTPRDPIDTTPAPTGTVTVTVTKTVTATPGATISAQPSTATATQPVDATPSTSTSTPATTSPAGTTPGTSSTISAGTVVQTTSSTSGTGVASTGGSTTGTTKEQAPTETRLARTGGPAFPMLALSLITLGGVLVISRRRAS